MNEWICALAAILLLIGTGRADDDDDKDKAKANKTNPKGSIVQIDLSKLPPEAASRVKEILKSAEKYNSKKPEPKKPEAKQPGKPAAPATEGIGKFVQTLHGRGLRGTALARAIHAELERRGLKEKNQSPGNQQPNQGKKKSKS